MLLQLTCEFLSCLCLEGDENGQEQDGHAEKRSAEEEEVSDRVRVMAVRRNEVACYMLIKSMWMLLLSVSKWAQVSLLQQQMGKQI